VIPNFQAFDILADSSDNPCDFMARDHWESSWTEIFTCLMYISVANTGELDFDVDIIITNSTTGYFVRDDWATSN
jgi:hypothetical protein